MKRADTKKSPQLPTRKEFEAIVHQANAGAESGLDELRSILEQHPQIWRRFGDMGVLALQSLFRVISGGEKLVMESLQRRTEELRRQLEGPAPTPLERLAVERVLLCKLELESLAMSFPSARGESPSLERYVDRCKNSAQRRLDAAVKSLLSVRSAESADRRTAANSRHSSPAGPRRARSPAKNGELSPANRLQSVVGCGTVDGGPWS